VGEERGPLALHQMSKEEPNQEEDFREIAEAREFLRTSKDIYQVQKVQNTKPIQSQRTVFLF
jgi:hypothetical protein